MKRETYAIARARILAHLAANGWTVKSTLKVPQACCRDLPTVYFHAQAVYLGTHSLWIDIRGMDGVEFERTIERTLQIRSTPSAWSKTIACQGLEVSHG